MTQKQLKVAVFVENYLHADQTYIWRQANHLRECDWYYLVRHLVSNCTYPIDKVRVFGDSFTKKIWSPWKLRRLRQYLTSTYSFLGIFEQQRLTRILRDCTPDVIHAHWASDAMLIAPIAHKMEIPIIVNFHGYDATTLVKDPIYLRSLRKLFRQMALALAVSDKQKILLRQLGCPEQKLRRHYIGLPQKWFSPLPKRYSLDTPFEFLIVGRLAEGKGHEDAIAAFARAYKKHKKLRLTIVGEGYTRERLVSQIRESSLENVVRLAGHKDETQVRKLMSGAQALLIPSHVSNSGGIEGLPTVAVEAAAVGLPIIATQHGGIPEIVNYPSAKGWLVPERDVELLAQRILSLATEPDLYEELSREGLEIAQRDFLMEEQNKCLVGIYRSVTQ